MRLISIDVGIKNLAFCLFEVDGATTYKICAWDIVDLSQEGKTLSCCIKNKNNSPCTMDTKFSKNGKSYCLKHAKKQDFLLPINELKNNTLNKLKTKDLIQLADKYSMLNGDNVTHLKKSDFINLIQKFVLEKCFEPICKTNSTKVDLVTIGRNIKTKFDILFDSSSSSNLITHVIIENQISPIANRMKTIQGMIAQYFIMKNTEICIDFISSGNKLKVLNENNPLHKDVNIKTTYNERKKLGILTCLQIIGNNTPLSLWLLFFQEHKKKDDLADCFLQGIWYMKTHNSICKL
jgi:hypothetical protein